MHVIDNLIGSAGTVIVYAADAGNDALTEIFKTAAFSGSWDVFTKFNWLGALLQFIISAFCLIGLVLVMLQRLMTMLYLSSKPAFDRIHEIKNAGRGGKALGLPGLVKDTIGTANHGTGLDAILSFILSLLPDIKAYSDYAEDHRQYNLKDDDTITVYMLKVALPTIMIVFFFAIGFNGTLGRAYGQVASAMATAADNVVNEDLSATVQKWMNSGKAYQFGYSADGTEFGKFKQKLAKDIYSKILAKSTDLTTGTKYAVGEKVDSFIQTNLNSITEGSDSLGNYQVTGFKGTDKDVSNLTYSVVINGTPSYTGEVSGSGTDVTTFGITPESSNNNYVHIFISKKATADETNYFEVSPDSNATTEASAPTQQKITTEK